MSLVRLLARGTDPATRIFAIVLPMTQTTVLPMTQTTNFWVEYKDFLALLVSFLALIVSSLTTWWTLRTTRNLARQNLETTKRIAEDAAAHNRRLAQDATYQRLHELLVDPKAA